MIEKLTKTEQNDLSELKRNPSFKLFKQKIVDPYVEQIQRSFAKLTVASQSEGPILAAELRMLRKIFDDLGDTSNAE